MPYHFTGERSFAVAQADLHGHLRFFDDFFAEILKVDPLWLLGRSFRDFTHPDFVAVSRILFENLVKTKMPYRLEKMYRSPGGEDIRILAHVNLLEDMRGQPIGAAAIIQPRG